MRYYQSIACLCIVLVGLTTAVLSSAADETLTNASIIELKGLNFGDAVIIGKIKTSKCDFDTSTSRLKELQAANVSDAVIEAMIVAKAPASVPTVSISTNKVKEPEYAGSFFRLNSKDGELIPLEKQNTQMHTGAGGFFVVKGETVAQIDGEKSPLRFKKGEKLDFIVKLASQENDPQTQIGFALFESVKGKRRVVLATATGGPFGVSGRETWQSKIVSYNAAKYGESSFRVSPVQQLLPGEYVLGIKGVPISFCFGVDGEESPSFSSQSANATNTSNSISDPEVEKLCASLESDKPGEVADALRRLRTMNAPEAVPKILPCLTNSNPGVVRDACRTLAVLGNKNIIPSIEPLLKNSRKDIRKDAQDAIDKLNAK